MYSFYHTSADKDVTIIFWFLPHLQFRGLVSISAQCLLDTLIPILNGNSVGSDVIRFVLFEFNFISSFKRLIKWHNICIFIIKRSTLDYFRLLKHALEKLWFGFGKLMLSWFRIELEWILSWLELMWIWCWCELANTSVSLTKCINNVS